MITKIEKQVLELNLEIWGVVDDLQEILNLSHYTDSKATWKKTRSETRKQIRKIIRNLTKVVE